MAFNFQWLTRVNQTISPFKGQNPAEGQATGGPTMWVYNASSTGSNESTATVEAANYFLGASGFFGVGDWIFVDTNTPGYLILSVTAVTQGTTVTTQTFTAGSSGLTFTGALTVGDIIQVSNASGIMVDSGILASNLMLKNAANVMSGSGQITLVKANGTEAANAVTASGNSGVITTSSLTTAGAGTYAITWTNTKIATTSVIGLTWMGGTNSTNFIMSATAGSGTSTLTITNTTAASALNGTIFIGYTVF